MASSEPIDPAEFLSRAVKRKPPATARRQRLFACGCARLVWDVLEPASRELVEAAERFADGIATEAELTTIHASGKKANRSRFDKVGVLYGKSRELSLEARGRAKFGWEVAEAAGRPGKPQPGKALSAVRTMTVFTRVEYAAKLVSLVRCVYHSTPFAPEWRTVAAVGIAAAMYDSREFANMPILADALQDAGCDSPEILDHCRAPGPHVRGCWVVDLVLGKS